MFAGCALGAVTDSLVRFPNVGAAILFPPYAVLTAALLATPTRQWWVYLLASAAGNFVPHLTTGPASFALMTELANLPRALIVAIAMRRFAPATGLAGLRGTVVFLVAGVAIAPAIAAAIGATVVLAFRSADFAVVWQAWFFSNALTALTLLPVLWLFAVRKRPPWWRRRRLGEAALLASLLVTVTAAVFCGHPPASTPHPATIYAPLPFLLWAAVRFDTGGLGASLLCVSGLTIAGAILGLGPFATGSPTEDLLQLQLFLIDLGGPLLLLASVLEQHRTIAEELRLSRTHFESIVEDQTEMISRFKPDGTYTFANEAFCRHAGMPRERLLASDAFALAPASALASITQTNAIGVRESQGRGPDGQPSWQQWTDRGLFDDKGQISEYQSVGRDITTDKLRARQERDLLDQQQAAVALRDSNRRKDEFLATLGHELRNLLAPIGLALEALRYGTESEIDAASTRDAIARQLALIKLLVDDLLDINRISRGDIDMNVEILDGRAVASQAVETALPLIESRRHALAVSLPERAVPIRGDKLRLAQVLVNLLNNAAKYTPTGGHISLELRIDGDRAIFRITDDGIGIPPDMLERVFKLFQRGKAPPGHTPEGLGVGLALGRSLAEAHGGTIIAHSDGKRGSEFVVSIPVVAGEVATSQPTHPVEPIQTAGLRILVVDDNRLAADGLARLLRLWGHDAHAVHDGSTALAVHGKLEPHVVLSDIGLPDVSGLELARHLRGDLAYQPPLLIAISGYGRDADRALSLQAGFDEHLVKPIDVDRLRNLLESHRP